VSEVAHDGFDALEVVLRVGWPPSPDPGLAVLFVMMLEGDGALYKRPKAAPFRDPPSIEPLVALRLEWLGLLT
jgi:hypothetical protein